jgi:hypothetical protein
MSQSNEELRRIAIEARKRWSEAFDAPFNHDNAVERDEHYAVITVLGDRMNDAEHACERANLPTNRFEVVIPADQTILLLAEHDNCEWGHWTTKHSEAKLFTSRKDAVFFARAMGDEAKDFQVSVVIDEDEYRSREDTW